jgi:two-component system phosphate regulon response regulator OmpR
MPQDTLLLIDDDADLAGLLQDFLGRQGYEVMWADRPSAGRVALRERSPQLVLLDVMLPEQDGFAVLQDLRTSGSNVPVIMLTAKGDDVDRIRGLQTGADDYLPKPFNPKELLARIEAVLRRVSRPTGRGIRLDDEHRQLVLPDRQVSLTPREYRLLERLMNPPGVVLSRSQLLDALDETGASDSFDRAIDLHISRLRQKIELDPKQPQHLLTVWGIGYRFEC